MPADGPLTFGQLSLWRNVQDLPRARWHEPNLTTVWPLPACTRVEAVRNALLLMEQRHVALRTTYDVSDPRNPRQRPHEPGRALDVAVREGTEDDAHRLVAEMAVEPFDLRTDFGWRVRIIARGDTATHLAMVHHHILADGWGKGVLWQDLLAAITSPDGLPDNAYSLVELAEAQRGKEFEARSRAVRRHWENTLTAASEGGLADGDASADVVQACLRSRRSRAAAAHIAERLGLTTTTVLLTAYAIATERVQHVRSIPFRLLAANRVNPLWSHYLTTMNQWTPAHVESGDDFATLARRLHRRGMQAYRLGMYDPDEIASLRGEFPVHIGATESAWAYNYITDAVSKDPRFPDGADDPAVTWEPVFQALGPRIYLRVTDDGHSSWVLRLRARGVPDDQVAALLHGTHDVLIAEGEGS